MVARAELALDDAAANTLKERLARKEVIEPPPDVALTHVAPRRPPREHLVVVRVESPTDVDEAVSDDPLQLRPFLWQLANERRLALLRMDVALGPGDVQV